MSSVTPTPKVSIVIPSWNGEVSRPMQGIEQQTFRDYQVEVTQRVSPSARARNLGARRARGDILLFIDDDASLGHEHVLQMMVDLLERDAQIAIVGVSQQVPVQAGRFQRAIASQLSRCSYPVVSDNLVSNPPLDRYGFTAITTLCCAIRRTVFEEVGGFDEELPTGEDTDFFYRVRQHGYNLVVAANCWVYHDPPASLKDLLRKSFWYGVGHALEARKSPERHMAVLPLNRWYGLLGLVAAMAGLPLAFFVHYYFDPQQRLVFGFRPLKTLSAYASLCGYVYGWYHGKPRKPSATYGGVRGGDIENAEVQTR
jgi:cellulose synthase/poly-beta-1,6-N-acetylglucosamine synthase-like glycosyltransferase